MLALRKTEPKQGGLSLDDIEPHSVGPGEVNLKVDLTGLCGTDLHIYNWAPWAHRMKLPTTIGHEITGVVEAVGDGVMRVDVGDRVGVESHVWCGRCYACNMERPQLCENTRYPGVDFDGGFASHVVLPEAIIWKMDAGISARDAALFEPFGVAVQACLDGVGVSGMNVLIAGCGPIGQLNILAARALGAHKVIATDVIERRLKQAARLDVDRAINVEREDVLEIVKDMTAGHGVDVVLECSGSPRSIEAVASTTSMGGEVRLIGVPGTDSAVQLAPFFARAINIRVVHGRRLFSSWEHATKLVRDEKVNLSMVVSHIIPLAESQRGFELALAGEADKVLIDPS